MRTHRNGGNLRARSTWRAPAAIAIQHRSGCQLTADLFAMGQRSGAKPGRSSITMANIQVRSGRCSGDGAAVGHQPRRPLRFGHCACRGRRRVERSYPEKLLGGRYSRTWGTASRAHSGALHMTTATYSNRPRPLQTEPPAATTRTKMLLVSSQFNRGLVVDTGRRGSREEIHIDPTDPSGTKLDVA